MQISKSALLPCIIHTKLHQNQTQLDREETTLAKFDG